jgi:hypothetical protein
MLASRLATPLGDQFVHEAPLSASVSKLLLQPSKELPAGLEDNPPALDSGRELVPGLDAESTANRRREDQPALRADPKRMCHKASKYATNLRSCQIRSRGP